MLLLQAVGKTSAMQTGGCGLMEELIMEENNIVTLGVGHQALSL